MTPARTSILPSVLIVCSLAVAACESPIRTHYDTDPSADFRSYRTYAWISPDPIMGPRPGVVNANYVSPIDETRIRNAVDAGLASRGYRGVSLEESDLVVSFTVGSQEKVRVEDVPGRSTAYVRGYGYGSWYAATPTRAHTYTQGTLILEFFDRASKQAVWVGVATKTLSSQDDSDDVIQRAVAQILEPFPVRDR